MQRLLFVNGLSMHPGALATTSQCSMLSPFKLFYYIPNHIAYIGGSKAYIYVCRKQAFFCQCSIDILFLIAI